MNQHATQLHAATFALLVKGQLEAATKYFATDYTVHLTDQDSRSGHELIRSVVGLYQGAFDALSVEVVVLVETSDLVAWQRTLRATHRGAFKGFPGTDLPITWREMVVSRFAGSLIAEEWIVTDLAERLLLGRKAVSAKPKRGAPKSKSRRPRSSGDA